jgi:Tol biopolymer transport system component
MIGVLSVATGERVRRLPARVREANKILDLSWSPDGSFFAYVDALNDFATLTGVSVLRASDGETIPVTHGRWTDWSPTWSSDSRTLFFVSNRGGSNDLWQQALGPDGTPVGDPQPVTTAVGMRTAAFSPDGKKLAYSKGREVASVWRVPIFSDRPATWSDAMQITFDEALIEFIDISPDGERLAVSSDRAGNHDLWVLPAEGGEMQPLTTDPTPDWFPRWSPDGKQIAFYAYRSGNRDIWVMPAGGGRARQLTTHEAFDAGPAWSPDGKTLAFMSARRGSDDIWTIPSDGGEPLRLTDDPGSEWSLSWSFDGEHIVFASITGGTSAGLWRLPASGGEPSLLTPVSDGTQILSRSRNEIFHHSTRNGSRNVWAIPAGGGRERQLTDFAGRNGNLRVNGLATDGEYLYFVWSEDLGDIWVMDVARDSGAS